MIVKWPAFNVVINSGPNNVVGPNTSTLGLSCWTGLYLGDNGFGVAKLYYLWPITYGLGYIWAMTVFGLSISESQAHLLNWTIFNLRPPILDWAAFG